MKVLDRTLDEKPSGAAVSEMAETRIRNLICFEELESYNGERKWKNRHPLLARYTERYRLEELRRRSPEEFLKEYAAVSNNIKRYRSYVRSETRASSRKSDKALLEKYNEMKIIFESILKDE
jgi:hypothetical protein